MRPWASRSGTSPYRRWNHHRLSFLNHRVMVVQHAMPAARSPVTESEVTQAVLECLAGKFKGRILDQGVARRGLAQAAFELIQIQLKEVGKGG